MLFESKLTGAEPVRNTKKSFMASITDNNKIICTATIIGKLLMLSTASCALKTILLVDDTPDRFQVKYGNSFEKYHQSSSIDTIDIHEEYDKFKNENPRALYSPFDVGLIKVSFYFVFILVITFSVNKIIIEYAFLLGS